MGNAIISSQGGYWRIHKLPSASSPSVSKDNPSRLSVLCVLCTYALFPEVALAGQCWQAATYPETIISPDLKTSSILRVPEVVSLAQCAGACCDLLGCDLAWFSERRCYVLSCHRKENCQPKKRPGRDSLIAFVQRGPPQTMVLQSLVRGEPYPNHWRSLPKHRGLEDPLKDLALLNSLQDFDNPDMEYAESYRAGGDEFIKGKDDSKAEPEESFRLPDWTRAQSKEEFNLSKTEGDQEKFSILKPFESIHLQVSPSSGLTEESRASPSTPDPSIRPSSTVPVTLLIDEHPQNVSATSTEPTTLLQTVAVESAELHRPSTFPSSLPHLRATPPTTSVQPARALSVSIGNPVDVTLPEDTVELSAKVSPEPQAEDTYTFEWNLISSSNNHQMVMEGKHNKSVTVSALSAGTYVLKVSVRGEQAYGENTVNITVHPATSENRPPKAIALPETQDASPPASSVVINGSQSAADTGIVNYLWEQVEGPSWEDGVSVDTPVLYLHSLLPGNYTFKLTVTDSDGQTDATTAQVRITEPTDDPPVADAGPDQVITLPLNHLTLHGNQSTDDHSINSYMWSLHPSSQTKEVTMQGVRTAFLQLSGLQEGVYVFQLTVTDSSIQQDSCTVTVTVLPENRPPVAVVGPDRQLVLPDSSITLNGTGSTDDQAITSFRWDIISGPPGAKIKDANKPVATVTGLRVGSHKFRLTVQDQQGAEASALLTVTVKEAKSLPLVAHASGSHTLTLPNNSLVLRGSVSNSASNNVSFLWVRDEQSPAAGDILYGSDHQASLYLANLVEGTYLFQLRVTDTKGRSSVATATVEVRPDPREREEVELELQVGVAQVSHQQKDTVVRQLAALLHVLETDIALKGLHGQSDISTVWRFSVQGPDGIIPGPKLARLLRNQLLTGKSDFLLFKVLRVNTVMCMLLCSGHGQCDPITRSCSCDPLWMENPVRKFLADGESNCDWSVLYVTVTCFVLIVLVLSVGWACICCWKRGRRTKVRKKTKYTILDNMDEQEKMELRPKYNIKHRSTEHNSSLMMSESEFDSEQDIVYSYERTDRARNRANGAAKSRDAFSLRPVDG
ncbi:dyslexia-associated protein KIAA0319 [Chanos chanos]|uniref:Dyslexia-associated protein KIAA0319 n=1 Tax=Chanos chanos TaxID=29144 RepID=A0A6J2W6I3_CHACN|nr:dyslexia-associated protein KIAA0319-like [Chanos chanos]